MAAARILIVGCGYVGGAFARMALADGHEVWALGRTREGRDGDGVRWLRGDLRREGGIPPLPSLDVAIFAAAPDQGDEDSYRTLYDEGWGRILTALAPQTLRRVLFVSSTSVYGEGDGEALDDDSPAVPRTYQGRHMRAGELRTLASGHPAAVLRLGGIYGPGREAFIQRVKAGQEALTPGVARYTNRVHRDDAAAMLHFLWQRPDGTGTFIGTDGTPAPKDEVVAWLAKRFGVTPPVKPEGTDPSILRGHKRCYPSRLHAMGFRWRFPSYREGYAALVP